MTDNFNDVTDAFDGWLQTITGLRRTGSYVDGRWTADADTPLSFSGVIQNAMPDDLKVLHEGNRSEESIKIHSKFELVPQVDNTTNGDIITYKGKNWLVHNVADRHIGGYFKAIAIRIN